MHLLKTDSFPQMEHWAVISSTPPAGGRLLVSSLTLGVLLLLRGSEESSDPRTLPGILGGDSNETEHWDNCHVSYAVND